jgi:hypothetical protein
MRAPLGVPVHRIHGSDVPLIGLANIAITIAHPPPAID